MTLETLTTVALLIELLSALQANDPKGFKTLLGMGLQPASAAQPTCIIQVDAHNCTASSGAAPAAVASV